MQPDVDILYIVYEWIQPTNLTDSTWQWIEVQIEIWKNIFFSFNSNLGDLPGNYLHNYINK